MPPRRRSCAAGPKNACAERGRLGRGRVGGRCTRPDPRVAGASSRAGDAERGTAAHRHGSRGGLEKYYDLFDFAPTGHFLWGHDGGILELNLAGAALLGLNRGAAGQRRFGDFVAAEFRGSFADFLDRVLTSNAKQTCEVKLQKDGSLLWVLIEGIAAQDRQRQTRLCRASVIDISQQKRADELTTANGELQAAQRRAETYRDRYVDLYDHAPLGYATLDEEGYIQEINLAGAAMLGSDRAELTGYEFAEHVVAADRATLEEHLRQCCVEHREATSELGLIAGQGRSITVQIHSVPIHSEGHEGTFTKTAITDITGASGQRRRCARAKKDIARCLRTCWTALSVARCFLTSAAGRTTSFCSK